MRYPQLATRYLAQRLTTAGLEASMATDLAAQRYLGAAVVHTDTEEIRNLKVFSLGYF